MGNSADRANVLTYHAGDIARPLYGNGIKVAYKSGFFWAYGYASPAVDAGVPPNLKNDRLLVSHGVSDFFIDGIGVKIVGHCFVQFLVA